MPNKSKKNQNIIVYTGPGSSNSWIWLADFLESYGFLKTRFYNDPNEILSTADDNILIIPGGDTFRIAESFGEEGLKRLKEKIGNGLGYIGICAGAYLPLHSTIQPLSSFNLLDAKISNISSVLPKSLADDDRYSVRYGCSYVFHPVRGSISLTGDSEITAPVYGGPFLIPSDDVKTHLFFHGFTESTEMLMERELCDRTVIGKAACIEGEYGIGKVFSIAPHLEHPDFPLANDVFSNLLHDFPQPNDGFRKRSFETSNIIDLKKTIADLRMLANALDTRTWKVGIKYWEGEKLLFFIDAVRKRVKETLNDREKERLKIPSDSVIAFQEALSILKKSKNSDIDDKIMDRLVLDLSKGTSSFLNSYFSMLSGLNNVK